MLQPHACAQHFRFRILRRTRSFPGRTSARSLPGGIESIWETPSKERGSCLASKPPAGRATSKPPCRATCPASRPHQPAESYKSYGSYGHTVIRWRLGTSGTRHVPAGYRSLSLASKPSPRRPRSEFQLRSPTKVGIPTSLSHRGRNSDFALPPRSEFRLRYFVQKTTAGPAPKVRTVYGSRHLASSGFHHSLASPSILRWQQDCPRQSCAGNRIALVNPALVTQKDEWERSSFFPRPSTPASKPRPVVPLVPRTGIFLGLSKSGTTAGFPSRRTSRKTWG